MRLSYVAAARADMKEGQQWLVPSPDGGCPEDREEEEQARRTSKLGFLDIRDLTSFGRMKDVTRWRSGLRSHH